VTKVDEKIFVHLRPIVYLRLNMTISTVLIAPTGLPEQLLICIVVDEGGRNLASPTGLTAIACLPEQPPKNSPPWQNLPSPSRKSLTAIQACVTLFINRNRQPTRLIQTIPPSHHAYV